MLKGMSMTVCRKLHDGALNGQSSRVSQATSVVTPSPGQRSCGRQETVRVSMPRQQVRPSGQSLGLKQGKSIFSQPRDTKFAGSIQFASGGAFVRQQTLPS